MKIRFCLGLCVLFLASLVHAQGPAAPYTVNLSWTVSTSSGITGQNVYRAPYTLPTGPCGTFVNITTTSLASSVTTYADTSMVNGSAYCYAVTAVGSTGESGLSNTPNVSIPPSPPTNVTASVK